VVRFELGSDNGTNLGGWTVDDFCVVGYVPTVCGDGIVTGLEVCDDGQNNSDTAPDACRTDCTEPICGDGVTDSAEACDDGNDDDSDACDSACNVIEDGGTGGSGSGGDESDQPGLEGTVCGCHIVGAPTRSRYGWLLLLGLTTVRRRRRAR
jgi:cysteine-rich repeat protein